MTLRDVYAEIQDVENQIAALNQALHNDRDAMERAAKIHRDATAVVLLRESIKNQEFCVEALRQRRRDLQQRVHDAR